MTHYSRSIRPASRKSIESSRRIDFPTHYQDRQCSGRALEVSNARRKMSLSIGPITGEKIAQV
jgi:hypothetical protein